ncbi:MAG: gamma-glutamylcyclotransferase [Magnetovibrio sp.]|nr:gamma-glutamylcyclotransferase [Magnetovibrio sp.]
MNTAHPLDIGPDDFWVFAYGSLMWNPGFDYEEVKPGIIEDFHRSLCVRSTIYRGTPENPGLVLGMDQGGSCCGRVFRVAPQNVNDTIAYLDEREQVTKVYCPHFFDTLLNDGRTVKSYTFVVRHDHDQYAGQLSIEEQARLVAQGIGKAGPAMEYLKNTIEHIDELGIHDQQLHEVYELAQSLMVKA